MPPESDRLQKLRAMLAKTPDDTFLVYGVGMELKKAGDPAGAVGQFDRVIALDPGYCYAYFQKGQVLEQSGDLAAAKQAYADGIAAAKTKGDAHALSELEGALMMVE